MRQLKGAIQDIADRMNDPIINDNITAIKTMVVIDKNIKEAVQNHLKKKEEINSLNTNENIIVTGDDMRQAMNREIDL